MTPAVNRRPSLGILALFLLLAGLPGRSYALALLQDVSRARAEQLGITVRSIPRADDVRVQVEFKTVGDMREFRWADLQLTQGSKRLVSASLMPRRVAQKDGADSVVLEFYLDPSAVPNSIVTIFVYNEARSGIGYRLKLKDFPPTATPAP